MAKKSTPSKPKGKSTRTKKKQDKWESYKKELLKRREELKLAVKDHAAAIPEAGLNNITGDSSDHAAADYAAELFGVLLEKQAGILEEIERALKKIENGEYGICEGCGKEIPAKRLKVIPWAKLCLECQDKIDKMEQAKRAQQKREAWEMSIEQ